MKVLQFPIARITIFFVFGILFTQQTKPSLQSILIPFVIIFIALLLSFIASKKNLKLNYVFSCSTYILSFLIGAFILIASNQTTNPKHYLHQLQKSDKNVIAEIVVSEKLKNNNHNDRYIAKFITLNGKKSYGKIILNYKKDSLLLPFEIGTHVMVSGWLSKTKKAKNPNQFDYAKYLENQQIYAQMYIDNSKCKVSSTIEKSVGYFANSLRNKIIHTLEKNHFNKTELNVIVALLLGQQQDIEHDIIRDYQLAGAVHILSVSGLHVGFILLFVTFLLKPIPNSKKYALFKLVLVIFSLWSYGILAGLAPSVVRSVTMFSFVAIGMFLRRSVNIYHTLLVSILLILLFQPSFLFDVGFQLSYVALFFIVWLQPFLSSIWTPKNKIIKYFWDIITVSFAAQIGTFPLSIYYFHQFPGLFFVTNLIILPMLSIILAIGVFVMVLAAFTIVWQPLLQLLEWSIRLLNTIIHWVASFEDFIFKDISFTFLMMWSCYLLLFSWIIWAMNPSYKKLAFSLIAIVVFQLICIESKYTNANQEEFIVFNKKKNTIITERSGTKVILNSTDSILKNYKDNQLIQSYLVANFCSIQQKKTLTNLYYFKNKKILVLDSAAVAIENIKPDIVLLTNSSKINLERLFVSWKPKQVVADASNYKSMILLWEATCRKEKIPFHATTEKGFYKL